MEVTREQDSFAWHNDARPEMATGDPRLTVDVEGFEGPLDLLLALARTQKVDLSRISILALANRYLEFIHEVRRLRLELAADYLVMAAWLAYLKSRLLLPDPEPDGEGLSAGEMAAHLAFRLKRLEAMREAAGRLFNRHRLGMDMFARGDPEPICVVRRSDYSNTLYDLLSAYGAMRQRTAVTHVTIAKRNVWSLIDARELLQSMVGGVGDWTRLDSYLTEYLTEPEMRATIIASSLAASLELVREGRLEIRQQAPFAPVYLRSGKNKQAEGRA